MTTVIEVLAGIAGLAVGLMLGFIVGRATASRAGWVYWLLNLLSLLAGIALDAAGLYFHKRFLVVFGLALLGGLLTGLKYGRKLPVGMGRGERD